MLRTRLVESVSVRRNRVADELWFQQRQRQRSNAGQCVCVVGVGKRRTLVGWRVKEMLFGGVAGRKASGRE